VSSLPRALTEGTSHRGGRGTAVEHHGDCIWPTRAIPARGCPMEATGAGSNRAKAKRRKADTRGVRRQTASNPNIRSAGHVVATVWHEAPRSYPGRSPGLRDERS